MKSLVFLAFSSCLMTSICQCTRWKWHDSSCIAQTFVQSDALDWECQCSWL